jgi:TetR/AcrR family transcriptional regulator, cholesterol catabolism regulator
VTVDDIAKEAGISKKTLYEQFDDKDAVVIACLDLNEQLMDDEQCAFSAQSDNAIHEIIMVIGQVEQMLGSMNANCIPDLQKYYPSAFTHFKTHMERNKQVMINNLKRGIKEGLYRKDFDIEFAVWMRLEQVVTMMQHPAIGKRFSPTLAQVESIKFYLYSISTIKGHELIEKYITQLKKKKTK